MLLARHTKQCDLTMSCPAQDWRSSATYTRHLRRNQSYRVVAQASSFIFSMLSGTSRTPLKSPHRTEEGSTKQRGRGYIIRPWEYGTPRTTRTEVRKLDSNETAVFARSFHSKTRNFLTFQLPELTSTLFFSITLPLGYLCGRLAIPHLRPLIGHEASQPAGQPVSYHMSL